jgi:hypothetical protein
MSKTYLDDKASISIFFIIICFVCIWTKSIILHSKTGSTVKFVEQKFKVPPNYQFKNCPKNLGLYASIHGNLSCY